MKKKLTLIIILILITTIGIAGVKEIIIAIPNSHPDWFGFQTKFGFAMVNVRKIESYSFQDNYIKINFSTRKEKYYFRDENDALENFWRFRFFIENEGELK
jgi:hypothetical protein